MTHLTPPAKALLAVAFSSPKSVVSYDMQTAEPSIEAQTALDELVSVGVLDVQTSESGALSYALTDLGKTYDRTILGATKEEQAAFMREHGDFPIFAQKAEPEDDGMRM